MIRDSKISTWFPDSSIVIPSDSWSNQCDLEKLWSPQYTIIVEEQNSTWQQMGSLVDGYSVAMWAGPSHRRLFADPVKIRKCTTGSMEPVNGINKDVSDAWLLPMANLTYPIDWVCFCDLPAEDTTLNCHLCPNGRYNLLLLPTHPLLCVICDINSYYNKGCSNPAASINSHKTLAK